MMNLPASTSAATFAAPLFELDRATVVRGATRVLHDLSLSIPLGQHTALLGEVFIFWQSLSHPRAGGNLEQRIQSI